MKIKHEDLLFLGNNYASATFSSPDWPTTAVVIFRDLSDDNKVNFALESVNGPWHNNSDFDFAKDYDYICGVAVFMLDQLHQVDPYEYWDGRIWEH
jgi:hypothetical protein